MKQGLFLSYCVSRTPLRVGLAMFFVCYAAWDWLWVTWKDTCCVYEYEMHGTTIKIRKLVCCNSQWCIVLLNLFRLKLKYKWSIITYYIRMWKAVQSDHSWSKHISSSNVYWTVHHCNSWRMKDQLDVTCYFISLIMRSTCFGH